ERSLECGERADEPGDRIPGLFFLAGAAPARYTRREERSRLGPVYPASKVIPMTISVVSPAYEARAQAAPRGSSTSSADHLRALEAESIHIMREVVAEFE